MTARASASRCKASNAADNSSTTTGFRAFTFPRSSTTVAIPLPPHGDEAQVALSLEEESLPRQHERPMGPIGAIRLTDAGRSNNTQCPTLACPVEDDFTPVLGEVEVAECELAAEGSSVGRVPAFRSTTQNSLCRRLPFMTTSASSPRRKRQTPGATGLEPDRAACAGVLSALTLSPKSVVPTSARNTSRNRLLGAQTGSVEYSSTSGTGVPPPTGT